jgi:adenylyltransferase/sulfurtransferase
MIPGQRIPISITTALLTYVNSRDPISIAASSIAETLDRLTRNRPKLRKDLFSRAGNVRAFVNLYLNDEECAIATAKETRTVTPRRHALHHPRHRGRD